MRARTFSRWRRLGALCAVGLVGAAPAAQTQPAHKALTPVPQTDRENPEDNRLTGRLRVIADFQDAGDGWKDTPLSPFKT